MLAKILKDDSQSFARDRILKTTEPITIALSVDSGMVADIMANVRDAAHKDLAISNAGEPLSTGDSGNGVVEIKFDVGALTAPRYVIWNIWVIYSGPVLTDPAPFTVTVNVTQGDTTYPSSIRAQVAPGDNVVAVKVDGLWIGAPL